MMRMAFKYLDYREQLLEEKRKNQALQAVVAEQEVKLQANLTATRKLINIDELTEEELTEIVDLYEPYNAEKEYQTGEVFRFEEKLYKAISTNTKEDKEALKPDELPDLYLDIAAEKKKVIELPNKELFK